MKGATNMFTLTITVVVLSVLYRLAWRIEPARKRISKTQKSHE